MPSPRDGQGRDPAQGGIMAALARAGFVCLPAGLGAGGRLGRVLRDGVVVRVNSVIWVEESIR